MAKPSAAVAMEVDWSSMGDVRGALREFWIKIPGLSAASDCDSASVIYYLQNPYPVDMVILEALCVITTLDAQDGDIDVGLADDADGTNAGVELFDSIVNTATGVFAGMPARAIAGTGLRPTWKASGSSTDSYITVTQNGDADVSALRWTLMLKLLPLGDISLNQRGIDKTTIAVA